MQEIEIKFRIEKLDEIKSRLLKSGCVFGEELKQKDTIFLPNLKDTTNGEGKLFIRIRSVNGKTELNLKKRSSNIMQSKEIEFEVSDFDNAKDFLNTLNLEEWVTVEKKRVTTKYKGFNICMDEVKRLGSFVEIEIITALEDKTQFYEDEILNTAKEIGIDISCRVNSFYDTMISELDKR